MSAPRKPPDDPPNEDAPTKVYEPTAQTKAPIQAISMKTPNPVKVMSTKTPDEPMTTPAMPRPKLRAMAEVAPKRSPQDLGHLAPPYDPNAARIRTMQDYVIWGCVAVIIASAIALVVWFAAR